MPDRVSPLTAVFSSSAWKKWTALLHLQSIGMSRGRPSERNSVSAEKSFVLKLKLKREEKWEFVRRTANVLHWVSNALLQLKNGPEEASQLSRLPCARAGDTSDRIQEETKTNRGLQSRDCSIHLYRGVKLK
ncbi:hypothetical protein SAY86_013703 [Trapa natans]|uniref:Uncharacterized protein n=1 Tax=Trapa natans TaxID=22666 RepID=A0AAN7KM54_TRANT|nr:hypothetical protein SAY86_013703 [Trapa natans]